MRDLPRSLTREGHRSRHSGRQGGRLHVVITDTRDDGRASLVAMGTPAGRISSEWRRFFLVFLEISETSFSSSQSQAADFCCEIWHDFPTSAVHTKVKHGNEELCFAARDRMTCLVSRRHIGVVRTAD